MLLIDPIKKWKEKLMRIQESENILKSSNTFGWIICV